MIDYGSIFSGRGTKCDPTLRMDFTYGSAPNQVKQSMQSDIRARLDQHVGVKNVYVNRKPSIDLISISISFVNREISGSQEDKVIDLVEQTLIDSNGTGIMLDDYYFSCR